MAFRQNGIPKLDAKIANCTVAQTTSEMKSCNPVFPLICIVQTHTLENETKFEKYVCESKKIETSYFFWHLSFSSSYRKNQVSLEKMTSTSRGRLSKRAWRKPAAQL